MTRRLQFGSPTGSLEGVVRNLLVPKNIQTEESLLAWYSEEIRPPYGAVYNWDAFYDCMRDLTWIPSGVIRIIHDDVPLANDPLECEIYVQICEDSVDKWVCRNLNRLQIFFPFRAKEEIGRLLEAQR